MKKVLQKIVLLIAVITVTGHTVFPHFHHEDKSQAGHHHHDENFTAAHHHDDDADDNGNQHNLFSFAQIDETFIPGKAVLKNFELPFTYLPALVVSILSDNFPVNTITKYGWYKEFPPPGYSFSHLPSRAPPASSFS
jgi:hypothetical protein